MQDVADNINQSDDYRRKTVALIMPALNEESNVDITFDAIFASTRLPDEIIVADGGSTDRTVEAVKAYEGRGPVIKIVDNPGVLPGAGRNVAAGIATSDILMLLDFGNKPDPDWIAELARGFEEIPDLGIAAGSYIPFATTDYEHCIAAIHYYNNYTLERYSIEERLAKAPPRPTPGGLSVAYSRMLWLKAGGQPEWLRTAEDTLFSRKLVAMGARLSEQSGAYSRHHMRSTVGAFFKQIFLYSRGHGRTRCVSAHFVKLVPVYGVFAVLLALAPWVAASGYAFCALIAAYYLYSGPRKLVQTDGKLTKAKYLWLPLLVVFPRDIAALLGHMLGWLEWVFRPSFRTAYYAYTHGSPAHEYALVPNR